MHTPVDLNQILHKKGLDPRKPYVGVVIDDNDPEKLSRLRVRLEVFQDSIPDNKLPWAIPENQFHPEGLRGGDIDGRSGIQPGIPLRGHKVAVYFRHDGDASNPSYGPVPIDAQNILPEFETNYPYRQGVVLHNGYTVIIDTKTNEVMIHNPGDFNLTVLGDCTQTVVGNLQQIVTSSTSDIPGYLRNAPETVLSTLSANPQKEIEFKGLKGGSSGNYHLETTGHATLKIGGDLEYDIGGTTKIKTARKADYESGGKTKVKGSRIDLN
jgi:hypothetical protein